jgi:choline kinase
MTRALILAAGQGTRLRPFTDDRPKCLVEYADRPLLAWQLEALGRAGIDDITVATGYRADQIESMGVATVHNSRFATSNMVATMACGARAFDGGDDLIIAYGDILYEAKIVQRLAASSAPLSTVVDLDWRSLWDLRMEDPLADAETLKLDPDGNIIELGRKPESSEEIEGQYIGLTRVSADFAEEFLRSYLELDPDGPYDGRDRDNMYMTSFLQYVIDSGRPLKAVPIHKGWLEFDTVEDLKTYRRLSSEKRFQDQYCPGSQDHP